MNTPLYDVAIVGGGASGLFCAWQCARRGDKVILLEKSAQVGRKILVSGNGRCNLTNVGVSAADYHGTPQLAEAVLKQFSAEKCLELFKNLGVLTQQENLGRVFPLSGKSTAVAEALRLACLEAGVEIRTQTEIAQIVKREKFILTATDKTAFHARRCVLACGSCAYPQAGGTQAGYTLAKSLGHSLVPITPALCALNVKEKAVARLQGIRLQGKLTAWQGTSQEISHTGEILFTSYGLSGPAALQLSGSIGRHLAKGPVSVTMDLLPQVEDKKAFIQARREQFGHRTAKSFFAGVLHENIINLLIDFTGVRKNVPVCDWTDNTVNTVIKALGMWPLTVLSLRPWTEAMVAAGGVNCAEINYNTMESLCCKGLYILGELLNVDGRSGGFNLHFAWGSAYVAANAMKR
ncbi:MAG: NAD(P)/FAD-dependent oxidoreductase [Elusimicrobiaceae bacterium]|nr:NAD(P)/FAD-dependent oxidoreductase [Elusimicrobiaceae bacterium]